MLDQAAHAESEESGSGRDAFDWLKVAPPGLDVAALDAASRETWRAQSRFLDRYTRTRTRTTACAGARVDWWELMRWEREDTLGFRARLELAEQVFADSLEDRAAELALALRPGQSATLLVTMLQAHAGSRYGGGAAAGDASREVLAELVRQHTASLTHDQGPPGETSDSNAMVESSLEDLGDARDRRWEDAAERTSGR